MTEAAIVSELLRAAQNFREATAASVFDSFNAVEHEILLQAEGDDAYGEDVGLWGRVLSFVTVTHGENLEAAIVAWEAGALLPFTDDSTWQDMAAAKKRQHPVRAMLPEHRKVLPRIWPENEVMIGQ